MFVLRSATRRSSGAVSRPASASLAPHGTQKRQRVTDHIRLYVVVKFPGYEPRRPYGPRPVGAAEVPFNHGQGFPDTRRRSLA